MSFEFLPVAAVALAAMFAAVTLREIKGEYAVLLSLLAAVLLMLWGIERLLPIIETIERLMGMTNAGSSHFELLLKAIGISLCTQFAADSCNDSGETSIASKIEFCGRSCLVALSLPLLEELLAIAEKILSW